jgi:Protein of unknown function (DUF2752)
VPATALSRRVGPERTASATLAIGALAGCVVLAAVDPERGGPYPVCPTRALLGIDCPACGTLRGLHDLSRGQLAAVASHNLLLLVAAPLGLVLWLSWVLAATGRPVPPLVVPRWAAPTAIVAAIVFTVARNLPVPALSWLGSS